jgi:segregation and condensation protein B
MPPDRDYQASVGEQDVSDEFDDGDDVEPDRVEQPEDDESELTGDDDDFDEAFEGPNPTEYSEEVPPELAPLPGEAGGSATVDSPTELPGEPDSPIDVGVGPDLEIPPSIEAAVEDAEDDERGEMVDAPLPADGDDAGGVFDAAADDDVSDDEDVDLPINEVVPDSDDDPAAAAEGDTSYLPEASESDPVAGNGDEPVSGSGAEPVAGSDGESVAGSGGGPGSAASGEVGEHWDLLDGAADQGTDAEGRAAGGAAIPAQGRKGAGPGAAGVGESARTAESDLADAERAPIDDAELRSALEAILLVVDEPVAEMQLAQIMEEPAERVAAMLEDISARFTAAGHGFDLRRVAGGWRLYTRPEYAAYVERFVLDGQSVRLTQAALETLAVVAYKQPVTRSRISAIRGVNCDGVMRTLATRGLIEECGTESETGAFLYRTTALFLEKLGLNSVDQLPPLAPFLPDDVEEVLDASG